MSEPLPVSVVLVTWDSAEVLPACLSALAASCPAPVELVAVDNASSDGSQELIDGFRQASGIATCLIRNGENRGFAAAANQGIEAAEGEYVFFLNPDVRLQPGTLAALCSSLSLASPDFAAAGGKLLRALGPELAATRVIDSTGIVMTTSGRHFDRGAGEADQEQYDGLGEVFGLSGAAVLLRRSALQESKVDGQIFDEDFFAYREDADLAWRLRGFGHRALYDPDAVAFHQRRVTPERRRELSSEINLHSVKNRFLLRIHHADWRWWLHCGPASLARDLLVIGACLSVERSSFPALVWLVRNFGRHWGRRRQILARRRVDSRELSLWFHPEPRRADP